MASSQSYGKHFVAPHNKDQSILGVYIGVPLCWGTTIACLEKDTVSACGLSCTMSPRYGSLLMYPKYRNPKKHVE